MKKMNVLMMMFVLGLVTWIGTANAQSVDNSFTPLTPWEVSILGGGVIPTDDKSDVGTNFQGRITYDITPHVAIGATAAWLSYDFTADANTGDVDFGDIHGMPLLATIILKMPLESTENRIVPYLVGGLGTVFWSFNENNGIDADDENTFAGLVGAGVDYFITDQFAVFAEASYLISGELDGTATVNSVSARYDNDVSNILFGLGLKAKF